MSEQKDQLVKLTGLWVNETKNGEKYFQGTMGMAKVLIFKNGYKEKDNDPDYNLFVAKKQKREDAETDKGSTDEPF